MSFQVQAVIPLLQKWNREVRGKGAGGGIVTLTVNFDAGEGGATMHLDQGKGGTGSALQEGQGWH